MHLLKTEVQIKIQKLFLSWKSITWLHFDIFKSIVYDDSFFQMIMWSRKRMQNIYFKIIFLYYSALMLKSAFSMGTQRCECQGRAGMSAKEGQKQGPQGENHSIHRLFSGPPPWDPT